MSTSSINMDGGTTPPPSAGKNFADMNNDEVVQFLFVVWKQFGAIYMNSHIHKTKGKIMGLKRVRECEHQVQVGAR